MNPFKKATRTARKLRLAVFGPSGSGKTYTALRIAHGIGGSIALIDTENSANIYSGADSPFPDWDIAPLEQPTIDNLLTYMEAAKDYKVLIIDSFSHAWDELLNEVSRIAKARYQGNTHAAWKDGNPKQEKLIKAILNYPGHLIVCMRSATEWVIEKDERTGKVKPQRVGLAPKQGKGIEYEFDMLIELNPDHFGNVIKSRFDKWQDAVIEKPGEEFGRELIQWLQDAPEPNAETAPPAPQDKSQSTQPANSGIDAVLDAAEKWASMDSDQQREWLAKATDEIFLNAKESGVLDLIKKAPKSTTDFFQIAQFWITSICNNKPALIKQKLTEISAFTDEKTGDVNSVDKFSELEKHPKWVKQVYLNTKDRFVPYAVAILKKMKQPTAA